MPAPCAQISLPNCASGQKQPNFGCWSTWRLKEILQLWRMCHVARRFVPSGRNQIVFLLLFGVLLLPVWCSRRKSLWRKSTQSALLCVTLFSHVTKSASKNDTWKSITKLHATVKQRMSHWSWIRFFSAVFLVNKDKQETWCFDLGWQLAIFCHNWVELIQP